MRKMKTRWEEIEEFYPGCRVLEHIGPGVSLYAIAQSDGTLLTNYRLSVTQCEWSIIDQIRKLKKTGEPK